MEFKKGVKVEFKNKITGSKHEGIIIRVKDDMIVAKDCNEIVHNVPFKFWDITMIENDKPIKKGIY